MNRKNLLKVFTIGCVSACMLTYTAINLSAMKRTPDHVVKSSVEGKRQRLTCSEMENQELTDSTSGELQNVDEQVVDTPTAAQTEEVEKSSDISSDPEKDVVKSKMLQMKSKLDRATEKLSTQPGCLKLHGDTAVVGDIHGDCDALGAIISQLQPMLGKEISNVLFLGDFLDRGKSTETFDMLLDFFNANDNVFILRGNHETTGFRYFCRGDANSEPVFKAFEEAYSYNENPMHLFMNALPHAAVVDEECLAVHGGIPWLVDQDIVTESLKRVHISSKECIADFFTDSVEKKGPNAKEAVICAIWSDFDVDEDSMRINKKRGVYESSIFGLNALEVFFQKRKLKHLVCGHDHHKGSGFIQDVYKDLSVTTVISSPALLEKCLARPVGSVVLLHRGSAPRALLKINKGGKASRDFKFTDFIL